MPPKDERAKPPAAPGNEPSAGYETEQVTHPRRAGGDDELLH